MNKSSVLFTCLTILLVLGGCKTQEQIQREQMVDNLSIQMRDSQSTRANFTVRMQELEERLGQLTGQLEESEQEQKLKVRNIGIENSKIMTPTEVLNFTQYFQRLTVHGSNTLSNSADAVFHLDNTRHIIDIP